VSCGFTAEKDASRLPSLDPNNFPLGFVVDAGLLYLFIELFYGDWHRTVVPSSTVKSDFFITVD
jgi:hypothetical protein